MCIADGTGISILILNSFYPFADKGMCT